MEGGKASGGPPLGPALGPAGVNVTAVVNAINEKTKDFEGMKVPVKVVVDPASKVFEIVVGSPPTSAVIMKELGVEKGSGEAGTNVAADLPLATAIKIARMKSDSLLATDLKKATKEILGTCISMGITVDGKGGKDVQKEITEGLHDDLFKED
ncbi:MAG: 50S ribosomal protein L11 [Candidatus Hydrothermarchaeales archaeon]